MKKVLILMTLAATLANSSINAQEVKHDASSEHIQNKVDEKNLIKIDLKDGPVIIELFADKAPATVKQIKQLVQKGFYNGIVFHRVIDGFMAQTGDPTGTGMGSSNLPNIKAEFNDISHVRGIVSMARSSDPNSANSQFFIVLKDATFLDRQYTVFGKVVSGMEFVDKIKKGDSNDNGKVTNPDKMIKVTLLDKSDNS